MQIKKIDELVSRAATKQDETYYSYQVSERLLELGRMQPAIAALANQHSRKI